MYLFGLLVFLTAVAELCTSKLIDLTHVHGTNTLMSLWHDPGYNRSTLSKGSKTWGFYVEGGWYSSSEHGGTHLDAPRHFTDGGMTLEKIPLEYVVLEGVMIDCAEEARGNDEYGATLDKIHEWEDRHGRIPDEAAILFNFNWSRKFDNEHNYKGADDLSKFLTYKYPYVGSEAAKWLLDNRKPRLIGGDVLSPDPFQINGRTSGFPIHRMYLPRNRLIIENLKDTYKLPARNFRFHAAPVAYQAGTGSQVRAYAITYDTEGNSADVIGPHGFWLASLWSLAIAAALFRL